MLRATYLAGKRRKCVGCIGLIALAALVVPVAAVLALAQELSAYRVVVEVETKSDWTTVRIDGFSAASFSVVEGAGAPDLKVSASGDAISVSKRQYDTTLVVVRVEGWLAFAGDAVNVRIDKGDLEYTTVRVYAVEGGRELLIWNFTNSGVVPGSGGVNPRSALLPRSLFARIQGQRVVVRERSVPKLVLAFYYPWYGNPQGPSSRWFHWERVSYAGIGSATDYPLLGPYDSWDPRVVRSHILMAKAAGVDGFVCSWWGINTFEDTAFARMLDVAAREGFNLTIYYESVREIPESQVVEELSYVLRKYSGHPAFLKIEGKPVVFVYAVEAYGRSPEYWARVLAKVRNATGIDAIFIADTFNAAYLSVFDGLHTYNPIWIKDHATVYAEEARRVRSYVPLGEAEPYRRLWVATANPGYDDRKIRKPGTYVPREGGAYYRRTWEASIASEPDLVLICTWNEWHEGTEIEPSREYGFEYLKLTREYATRYKGVEPPSPPAPSISLSLREVNGSVELVVENRGGPAVATVVELVNATPGAPLEPEGLSAYRLPINSTSYAIHLPYIGAGESVRIACVPLGATVEARATAWSATGEASTAEASIRVSGYAGRGAAGARLKPVEGPPLALIGGAAAAAVAALLAAWALLRRYLKREGGRS